MYEVNYNKNYIYIAILIVVGAICWALFADNVSDNRGTVDDIRTELNNLRAEQQKLAGTVENIRTGIEHSQSILNDLEQTNRNIEGTVENIQSTNNSITNSISNAQTANANSRAILVEDEFRIKQSKSILQAVRETKQETESTN